VRASGPLRLSGNIVTLSLLPLPSRTTISRRVNSTSFIRSRKHSSKRIPVPYSKRTIKSINGSSRYSKSRFTSSAVNTVGNRTGFFARVTESSQGNSSPNTSLYKNSNAESAWGCVEALTFRSTASDVKNVSNSSLPIPAGCRLSWKIIYRLISRHTPAQCGGCNPAVQWTLRDEAAQRP
jgi:hypothetical protein